MNRFSKKDFVFCLITGLTTGVIAWRIFIFLGTPSILGIPVILLVPGVPILWIIGVNFGYFLGRWIGFFNQFGRYAAVGFTNAVVDFGVLNLQIGFSGINDGPLFAVFKAISFLIAVTHSYFWNRLWVFESSSTGQGGQYGKFMAVNIIAILINVGTAYGVVNFIDPQFGLTGNQWANVGAVAGSAVALMFNFVGFKLVVFKPKTV
jgi:putative flippase GtrA